MKTLAMTAGTLVACLLAGCASAPPVELKNARAAYGDTANSPAAQADPTDVHEAQLALNNAESSFKDDGDSQETRDLAYVAERKAMWAKANGNMKIALDQKKQTLAELEAWKQQQAIATKAQLGATKNALAQTQEQLASERAARAAAEARTAEALAKIAGMKTKQETRGLVLTLNGSVLFEFGKSQLLPAAQKRLDEVVAAVKEDGRDITVAGYTDSVGSDETNMQLSQARAESVASYLTSHGIPQSKVTAKGFGKSQPIADNKTAEGRADNRRVEIILNGKADTTGTPMKDDNKKSGN